MSAFSLYDKIFQDHVVRENEDGSVLLYIDRQLLHEVTSPQAFEGLALNHRPIWRLNANLAVPDHSVPTTSDRSHIEDPIAALQVETLENNCKAHGILEFALSDQRQGIVHIIGPEQGFTLPGITLVCGDSHTSTHGAFGAISMGVGTSEVEHVLATQCLVTQKSNNMKVEITGDLPYGVYAKDLILAIISKIGAAGGTGFAIEYAGQTVERLSMEARMTLCNMSIEAGARCGLVAVDDTTIEYLHGRPFSPQGQDWDMAVNHWRQLQSDPQAQFDEYVQLNVAEMAPQVTWGTSPDMVVGVDECIPDPIHEPNLVKRAHMQSALKYMGLKPNMAIQDIPLDRVFIGSCTNSRIEDLREAAKVIQGQSVSRTLKQALVVPGSGLVKAQAEQEGLDHVFKEAGFEWREPGCSMCIAMNPDRLEPHEHCASTSNRNFEGRQGQGGCTHLVSPRMAAAAAIAGHFVDVRESESTLWKK